MSIEPDTKDWTWVLERPCPECRFDASAVPREQVADVLREDARGWRDVLAAPDARVRPDEATWSPLEYACHVRDVHRVFGERVRRMLEEDDPTFEDWDQDAAAVEERYGEQDPADVANELVDAGDAVADRYAAVEGPAWQRPGRRSNGSTFIVETLALYHLHDALHHAADVRPAAEDPRA